MAVYFGIYVLNLECAIVQRKQKKKDIIKCIDKVYRLLNHRKTGNEGYFNLMHR